MKECLKKITPLVFIKFTGFVAFLCLGGALIAEKFFNIMPCILCIYERYVYLALVGVALFTLLTRRLKPLLSIRPFFLLLGLTLLSGAALGLYHLGVEEHWWRGTAACHGVASNAKTLEEFRAALFAKPPTRCDQVNWRLLGISATWWNLAWFLGFLGLWGVVWREPRKN